MRKLVSVSLLVVSAALVAGCQSGTTYGTGVTHEEQTFDGLVNILAFKPKETERIDYRPRPELVMPAETAALPQPLEENASTSNADWPETPEERIARIRGEAVKPDARTGEVPVEELLRKKEGINKPRFNNAHYARRTPVSDNGDTFLQDLIDRQDGKARKEVLKRRAQLAYSKGATRKYLTEPPTEYRTPAATAVAGDLGYSEEELKEIARKEEARKKAERAGTFVQ